MWQYAYRLMEAVRRTDAVQVCQELLRTQWQEEQEINKLQLERLQYLLRHAQANVPYYKNIFQAVGFNAETFDNLSQMEIIPILTKDKIRKHFNELKASDFKRWQPRRVQTGGSTGTPLATYKDRGAHSYLQGNSLRAWHAAGYGPGDEFVTLANGSLLPRNISFKNRIYFFLQHAHMIPCYHMNDATLAHAINVINRSRAQYLFGYSSTIYLLATYINKTNDSPIKTLKAIFTTSDMLYPHQRAMVEKVFTAPVFDIYGCPEGGILSFECAAHQGYHLNQESAYVEVVNKDTAGLGRIVSTPLFNYAFPMIRYDTGDVGSISRQPCRCGRKLPRVAQLGGRIRDFVVLRDGRHIHGAFFNHLEALYQSEWIENYQVVQETLNRLVIKLACKRPPTPAELQRIEDSLHKGLLPDLCVEFDLNGVERAPSGKFRLVVSKVKSRWEA